MSTQNLRQEPDLVTYYSLTWKFAEAHFKDLATMLLILLLPGIALGIIVAGGALLGIDIGTLQISNVISFVPAIIVSTILVVVIEFIIMMWSIFTITNYVTKVYKGAVMTWKQALSEGWQLFLKGWSTYLLMLVYFFLLFIVVGVIVGFFTGMLLEGWSTSTDSTMAGYILSTLRILLFVTLGMVPILILGVYWMFISNAIVSYDKTNMSALNFSKNLVKGRWWKMLGYLFVSGCISIFVSGIFTFILGMFGSILPEAITSLLDMAFTLLLQTFFIIYFTIVFLHIAPQSLPENVVEKIEN